jgi:hypothetical protein
MSFCRSRNSGGQIAVDSQYPPLWQLVRMEGRRSRWIEEIWRV